MKMTYMHLLIPVLMLGAMWGSKEWIRGIDVLWLGAALAYYRGAYESRRTS
jgi:hypothetical protein